MKKRLPSPHRIWFRELETLGVVDRMQRSHRGCITTNMSQRQEPEQHFEMYF
jgi:hypothetical protein